VIFEDRNTDLITLCMLGKSSVVMAVREDVDEDDEDDEVDEEGRACFRAYVPRLILVRG
jgi:hypothetical protein